MMMLWRLVTVWLVLAIVCRYPNCHVGCTEQLQDSPPPPPQDVSQKEGTDDQSGAHKADETLEPHVQPLSEDELLIEGDEEEEWVATQGQVEEEEQNVEALATVEAEQELMGELERAAPDSSTEAEDHPPPSSITQEHPTASPLQPSPEPSHPAGDGPEDAPSTTTSQDHTVNSVSEDPTLDEAPVEPDDGDKATADCEAGDTNPFDNASPPVILENSSNAHSAGTKTHTDPSLSPQAGPVTPGVGQTMNTSHTLKEKGVVEMEPSVPTKEPEDIPTFDEWKRKVMEVEKEKTQATHSSSSGSPHPVKKVQKNFNNYASVECGAKILGSNPEAKSTSAILMENMDLYMLNPCSNKIWFIIELCEPIQLKQLDIANFELFSSTPKDFLVSISDRYPTNKWLKLGTFHGRDERTVQSFPLDEHLYAKYVKMFAKYMKVELVSHFGSEHFCPLSLIRVFGTSMVEEYEEIADPSERPDDPDDDLDYVLGSVAGEDKSPKNLIGSAKDVILNMVNNIAVNVLGGGQDMDGNFSTQELNMTDLVVEFNTTDVTAALNLSIFDTEEADGPQDLDIPVAEIPPSEAPPQEPPATPETPELQLPAEEDKFITGLHEEEEESISSTITLLDKEDEDEVEEREEKERRRRQQESSDYCSLSPPLSSSSSSSFPCSSCSCSASLQEYLHRQCSALVSKTRERQVRDRESATPPDDGAQATAQRLPPFDSTHPTPQEPPIHTHQPEDREPTPALDLREDVSAELVDPPKEQARAEEESGHVLLEPSMTCAIPTSTTRTPVTTTPTPTAELPHLPTTDLQAKEPRPEKSQEVQAEEEQTKPTTVGEGVPPTPASNEPGAGATVVEQTWPLLSPVEDKPEADVDAPKPDLPVQGLDPTEHLDPPVPNAQQQPGLPAEPENKDTVLQEASPPNATAGAEQEASADTRAEDHAEDVPLLSSSINGQPTQPPSQVTPTTASASPAHSDFYAENSNGSEAGNGNQVPTSSQKESVFMRLNNRIKALEMNMSLSGRYLEQLSQRYRKQMEEMQKAFNKTIIKLQNTSRIAEEQDQRQTESIQSLHGQLENITQLVLNLSVRVSQLQTEVSDRQSYLLLCLVLCLILGLFLCVNHCRMSDTPTTSELDPPVPKSYSYCCPEREFTSFDDMGLTRRASYPLLQSESYLLTTTDGPQLHIEEAQRCSPANRRKKRGKMKPSEKVETLRPSYTAPELTNGTVVCNGTACTTHPTYPALGLLHPAFRDSPSEGSSEASSHSDDPSFCGIATACTRLCDGLPPPRTRSEKRALRRKRSKPTCMVVDLPQAPRRDDSRAPGVPNPQDLVAKNKELNSGTFGASIAL